MAKEIKNMGASVRARLLNVSKERGQNYQLILTRYANERLLYRLAQSEHAGRFVLKGAVLLMTWFDEPFRGTRDVDLLGHGDPDPEGVLEVFQDILAQDADDGVRFDAKGAVIGRIREDTEYGGLRIKATADVGGARVPISIDVGFGDATEPQPEELTLPGMLDMPPAKLRGYARETVIAEKFQAMVALGLTNTRIKDCYDVWLLSQSFEFDEGKLARAIAATFERCGTDIPGVQTHHEFLPQPGDRLWTPADWAWAGGLLNVLLPGLLLGVPVVSSPAQKFDPELAFRILDEMEVRNAFIPPTALRIMKTVKEPRARFDLKLRTVGSGGESLGRKTYDWAKRELGLTINEFYGQTECNLVLASCQIKGVTKGGAIGQTVPGHTVAVIDEAGNPVAPGVSGQIAVLRPDPVMFLGYWQNEEATKAKFLGDWLLTGDQGTIDEEGYVTFFGRDDDVITSSGYRIGPSEIEDCLAGHPGVALAAAVGKPDPVRTEIVKAYVVPAEGYEPGEALASEIREWVKTRLSAHEYPREIAFVESLPLTTTGKVIRRELRELAVREASGQA